MKKAIYPGSFDPPTNGHVNIIERVSKIFDEINIVIAVNPLKKYLFSDNERLGFLNKIAADYKNVKVHLWSKLIVDFAENIGANVIIRGVRALDDFSHEFELSMINRGLNADIETIIIPTDPKYFVLRSSAIKELSALNADISDMVPPFIEKALKVKFFGA